MSFLSIEGKLQTVEVLLDIILGKCCTNVPPKKKKTKKQALQAEGAASRRNPILTSYKQPPTVTVLIKHCQLFHTIYITPIHSTFWLHNRPYGGPTQPVSRGQVGPRLPTGTYEMRKRLSTL